MSSNYPNHKPNHPSTHQYVPSPSMSIPEHLLPQAFLDQHYQHSRSHPTPAQQHSQPPPQQSHQPPAPPPPKQQQLQPQQSQPQPQPQSQLQSQPQQPQQSQPMGTPNYQRKAPPPLQINPSNYQSQHVPPQALRQHPYREKASPTHIAYPPYPAPQQQQQQQQQPPPPPPPPAPPHQQQSQYNNSPAMYKAPYPIPESPDSEVGPYSPAPSTNAYPFQTHGNRIASQESVNRNYHIQHNPSSNSLSDSNSNPLPYPIYYNNPQVVPPVPFSSVQPLNHRPIRTATSDSLGSTKSQQSTMSGPPAPGSGNRRIVSSPNIPQFNNNNNNNVNMNMNMNMNMNNGPLTPSAMSTSNASINRQVQSPPELRTRSLNSASINYNQQRMQQSQSLQFHPTTVTTPTNSSSNLQKSASVSHTPKSKSSTSISRLASSASRRHNSSSSLVSSSNNYNNNNNNNNNHKLDRTTSNSSQFKGMSSMKQPALLPQPSVYPAILSKVAKSFKDNITLSINTKNGLVCHDSFTGKSAVDIICRIIRTGDRNLALLLGRSLDAQQFFHDVTYVHRLRDSIHEVYVFNPTFAYIDLYTETDEVIDNANNLNLINNNGSFTDYNDQSPVQPQSQIQGQIQGQGQGQALLENVDSSTSLNNMNGGGQELTESQETGVNGVFTILTDCYSPTCTKYRLCYSIACPRRLEQQRRLNLKPQGGLKRADSRLSLHEPDENKQTWHDTVPESVLAKLDSDEKTRQEVIFEFIYTERDYVKDLEFVTDFYIIPLRNPNRNIIPAHYRENFILLVFGGIGELLKVAKSFSEALTRRQQSQKPVVENICDIILDHVNRFDPFIAYAGNHVFATHEHERQLRVNERYSKFIEETKSKPESRKQDLTSFLIKAVQRPARYILFLEKLVKYTKEDSPDFKYLSKVMEPLKKLLERINIQTGICTDRQKVLELHKSLGEKILKERYHFKLSYSNRIIHQASLTRKRDNEKIEVYLFEHALLLVKTKIQNKRTQKKVFERPIYLPLLFINSGFDIPNQRSVMNHRYNHSIVIDGGNGKKFDRNDILIGTTTTPKLQLNFLGMGGIPAHFSLFASDIAVQNQILNQVHTQQKKLIDKYDLFSIVKYETRRFHGNNKINCAVPCYGGKKLLYGTDTGVWVSTVRSISTTSNEKIVSDPTLVISKVNVTQIEVVVEYSKLFILSDKVLFEFDLSCTDSLDHIKNTKSGKRVIDHISFFKTGIHNFKILVAAAKTGSTHSISVFEVTSNKQAKGKRHETPDIKEILFNSDPVSISFLKTQLCIGCTKGFEIISLEHNKKEPILDEADPSLDFATQREQVTPLAIHRLGKEFLLCYTEFVFLINKNGWRSNHEWGFKWEGMPQNVALFFPYLLSFEPNFIEIRDLHSTSLLRALVGENIRFLHSNEHEALYACEENGYDIIVSIDFLNLKSKVSSPSTPILGSTSTSTPTSATATPTSTNLISANSNSSTLVGPQF